MAARALSVGGRPARAHSKAAAGARLLMMMMDFGRLSLSRRQGGRRESIFAAGRAQRIFARRRETQTGGWPCLGGGGRASPAAELQFVVLSQQRIAEKIVGQKGRRVSIQRPHGVLRVVVVFARRPPPAQSGGDLRPPAATRLVCAAWPPVRYPPAPAPPPFSCQLRAATCGRTISFVLARPAPPSCASPSRCV